MSTYVIGDVQGCYQSLKKLLKEVNFSTQDKLWLVGDLINRGPDSLSVLRFVQDLGKRCVTVIGNHEFHLIGLAKQFVKTNNSTSLDDILNAHDCDELIQWICQWPLLHYDAEAAAVMVHAGIPIEWNLTDACKFAKICEDAVKTERLRDIYRHFYKNKPDKWSNNLRGLRLIIFIANALTRMRYYHVSGRLNFESKCSLNETPYNLKPWFAMPNRQWPQNIDIIFGHWSAIGYYHSKNIYCIDSGCVWGKELTALRLEDKKVFHSNRCD